MDGLTVSSHRHGMACACSGMRGGEDDDVLAVVGEAVGPDARSSLGSQSLALHGLRPDAGARYRRGRGHTMSARRHAGRAPRSRSDMHYEQCPWQEGSPFTAFPATRRKSTAFPSKNSPAVRIVRRVAVRPLSPPSATSPQSREPRPAGQQGGAPWCFRLCEGYRLRSRRRHRPISGRPAARRVGGSSGTGGGPDPPPPEDSDIRRTRSSWS